MTARLARPSRRAGTLRRRRWDLTPSFRSRSSDSSCSRRSITRCCGSMGAQTSGVGLRRACVALQRTSGVILLLSSATTVVTADRAWGWRTTVVALMPVSLVWLLSLTTSVRARAFVWLITAVFSAATLLSLLTPLNGRVLAIERVTVPWGETLTVVTASPGSPLTPRLVLGILTVNVFGLYAAYRMWPGTEPARPSSPSRLRHTSSTSAAFSPGCRAAGRPGSTSGPRLTSCCACCSPFSWRASSMPAWSRCARQRPPCARAKSATACWCRTSRRS